jgi:hypothetical protein
VDGQAMLCTPDAYKHHTTVHLREPASATSADSFSLLRSPCFSASTVAFSTASNALSPLQPHAPPHVSAPCQPHIDATTSPGYLPMHINHRGFTHLAHANIASIATCSASHASTVLRCLCRSYAGTLSPSCRRQQAGAEAPSAAYRSRPLWKGAQAELHPPPCWDGQRLLMAACWGGCLPHATCSPRRCSFLPPPPCWTARHVPAPPSPFCCAPPPRAHYARSDSTPPQERHSSPPAGATVSERIS